MLLFSAWSVLRAKALAGQPNPWCPQLDVFQREHQVLVVVDTWRMTLLRRWLEGHAWEEVLRARGDTSEGLPLWVAHARAVTALTDCSHGWPRWNRGALPQLGDALERLLPRMTHVRAETPLGDCVPKIDDRTEIPFLPALRDLL